MHDFPAVVGMQRSSKLTIVSQADGACFLTHNPNERIGHFRQSESGSVAHAKLNGQMSALAYRKNTTNGTYASHGNVQSSIVHAAILVEHGFNERRIDVSNELCGALDVVSEVGLLLNHDERTLFS